MILGGFIATQREPELQTLEELCRKNGVEYRIDQQTLIISGLFTHSIHLKVTSRGVKFRAVLPEYFAYSLILAVAFVLSIPFLTLHQMAFFVFMSALFFLGVKIYYDRKLRKIVETMLPVQCLYLPELATEENQRWMNDETICPGCGYRYVQYFENCPECGLKIGQRQKVKSSINTTQLVNFKYIYEKSPKNSRKSDLSRNRSTH